MRIAVSFLVVSMMVLVSHQQRNPFQYFANMLPPWAQRQEPTVQDLYDFLYARSLVQSLNPPAALHLNPNVRVNHGAISPEPNQWDVQSRNKGISPLIESSLSFEEQLSPRVFLNYVTTVASNSYFNPFLKTVYYISTSTATSTKVTSCIPAGSFVAGSSTVTCRRRREVMSILLDEETNLAYDGAPLEATAVLPMEASRDVKSLINDENAIVLPIELASSKSDEYSSEGGIFRDVEQSREKRLFVASTTITTVVFVTSTSTKTLTSFGGAAALSCIPSIFALC